MPTSHDYREQANLFFRMALVCSDGEQAAQFEAQGRLYADLAEKVNGKRARLNPLLEGFNQGQCRKA
jgi:hypothetical protein